MASGCRDALAPAGHAGARAPLRLATKPIVINRAQGRYCPVIQIEGAQLATMSA
jgi:hypothetical protein